MRAREHSAVTKTRGEYSSTQIEVHEFLIRSRKQTARADSHLTEAAFYQILGRLDASRIVISMDLNFAFPEVRKVLESWVGYPTVADILAQCKDLEIFIAGGAVRNCFIVPRREARDFEFFL